MKPGQVIADLAREEDREGILELNKLEYGPSDILVNKADFVWRYTQNPAGQAVVPVIRDHINAVVGFIWIVPLRLRLKGQNCLAATGTNLVIHPYYRNALNYIKLMRKFEQAFNDNNLPLHFSFISEKKYRELCQHAPQTAATIPLLVKPLNPRSLTQNFPGRVWQRLALGGAGQLLSPFFSRHSQIAVPDPQITIQAVDQFGEEFDQFWDHIQDKYPTMTVRDRTFLAWRFATVSDRRYQILVAQVANQMLGYVVLRCATIRGVKTGLIMDFMVVNSALGEISGAYLLAEVEAYFREQDMSLAVALMVPLTTEYHLLRQAGYLYLPRLLTPRAFRFAFFIHNSNETDLLSLSVQDWFITLADYKSF